MRGSVFSSFIGRIIAAALLVVGLAIGLKVLVAGVSAVVPAPVMGVLDQGADLVYRLTAPALPSFAAIGIMWLLYWAFTGGRGRQ
jgi:hypothetical protein